MIFRKNKKNQTIRRSPSTEQDDESSYAFRRSRTITGSSNDQVSAFTSSGAQLKTDRIKLNELHATKRRIGGILFVVLVITGVLTGLFSQYIGLNRGILYDGETTKAQIQTGQYQASIRSYFEQYPLEQFSFMFNTERFSNFIVDQHAEVSRATYQSQSHMFLLSFRQPLLTWSDNGVRSYVDATGTVFKTNYFAEPNLQLVDKSGLVAESNGSIVSGRFVTYTGQLVAALSAQSYQVSSIELPSGTTHQVDVRVEGRDYSIKTSIDRDAVRQASDVSATLKYLDGQKLAPQYIDNRIEGKAYYR